MYYNYKHNNLVFISQHQQLSQSLHSKHVFVTNNSTMHTITIMLYYKAPQSIVQSIMSSSTNNSFNVQHVCSPITCAFHVSLHHVDSTTATSPFKCVQQLLSSARQSVVNNISKHLYKHAKACTTSFFNLCISSATVLGNVYTFYRCVTVHIATSSTHFISLCAHKMPYTSNVFHVLIPVITKTNSFK